MLDRHAGSQDQRGRVSNVLGHDPQSKRAGSTVADVMDALWGVRADTSDVPRMTEPGWSYEPPDPGSGDPVARLTPLGTCAVRELLSELLAGG
jgi:hypothetical protein